MGLGEKLDRYFKENGVQRKWFAEKIGMSAQFFYQLMSDRYKVGTKFWPDIIKLTRGYITLADLLKHEFKDSQELSIEELTENDPCSCKVNIKNLTLKQ